MLTAENLGLPVVIFRPTRKGANHSPLADITDWNPTICEFAGGCPMPPAQPLDGVSAWGALTSGSGVRTTQARSVISRLCSGKFERGVLWLGSVSNDCWRGLLLAVVRKCQLLLCGCDSESWN